MNLTEPCDAHQFTTDIDQWLSQHCPANNPEQWFNALARQGWLAIDWPARFGGTGWSRQQQWQWLRQASQHLCPLQDGTFTLIAPLLLGLGSPAQCHEHLPGILDRTIVWGTALTRPESLQAKAAGDGWQLTGHADYAGGSSYHGLYHGSQGVHAGSRRQGDTRAVKLCLLAQDPALPAEHDTLLLLLDLADDAVAATIKFHGYLPGADTAAVNSTDIHDSNQPAVIQFSNTPVGQQSLLGIAGQGQVHLSTQTSCYQALAELNQSYVCIARLLPDETALQKKTGADADDTLAHRLTEFRVNLDAVEGLFLRADRDALVRLRAAELRTQAMNLLQDALGYYALPEQALLPGSNEPALPFEAERQHLRHLRRRLHAQDTSVQRDEIFTSHATDGDS